MFTLNLKNHCLIRGKACWDWKDCLKIQGFFEGHYS